MEDKINYTTIHSNLLRKYNLTIAEYYLVDLVSRLSKRTGTCYATRQWLAHEMNITKDGLLKLVDRLVAKGFLFKDSHGKLTAIPEWNLQNDGIDRDIPEEKEGRLFPEKGGQNIPDGRNIIPQGRKSIPNNKSKHIELTEKDSGEAEHTFKDVTDYYKNKAEEVLGDGNVFIQWGRFTKQIKPLFDKIGYDRLINVIDGFFKDDWVKEHGFPFGMIPGQYMKYMQQGQPTYGYDIDRMVADNRAQLEQERRETYGDGYDQEVSDVRKTVPTAHSNAQ